jgi:hypothetical protein
MIPPGFESILGLFKRLLNSGSGGPVGQPYSFSVPIALVRAVPSSYTIVKFPEKYCKRGDDGHLDSTQQGHQQLYSPTNESWGHEGEGGHLDSAQQGHQQLYSPTNESWGHEGERGHLESTQQQGTSSSVHLPMRAGAMRERVDILTAPNNRTPAVLFTYQ